MNWNYVQPLVNDNLINKYEKEINYTFPFDFKECVKQNNGGFPEYRIFFENLVFGKLLSFNKEDKLNIWSYKDWNDDWKTLSNNKIDNYVAFAIDAFGNFICFDKNTNEIVLIDHESTTFSPIKIANTFSELVHQLK